MIIIITSLPVTTITITICCLTIVTISMITTILVLTILYILAPGWLNVNNFLLRDTAVFYGAVGLVLAMGPIHFTLFYYQVQEPFSSPVQGTIVKVPLPLLLPPAAKLFDME